MHEPAPSWPTEVHAVLRQSGIRQAFYVPDAGLSRLIELLHADPAIAAIVGGWPASFTAERARRMGFAAHEPLDALVQAFIDDELAPSS